jgi:hypothetical protein
LRAVRDQCPPLLAPMIDVFISLLDVWCQGYLVQGPLLAHAKLMGHGFWWWQSQRGLELTCQTMPSRSPPGKARCSRQCVLCPTTVPGDRCLLPKYTRSRHQDYDYEVHALEALDGLSKLFRRFRTSSSVSGQAFMPTPPGLINREGRNLHELRKFISGDEILELESVDSLKLVATTPGLLSEATFIHATELLGGLGTDKYFFPPGPLDSYSFYVNIKFLA